MTPQERLRIFNQERQQQGRTAEERRRIFLEEQAAKYQPPPERSALQALGGGLAQAGGEYLVDPAVSLYQAGKSAVGGDFGPAKNLAESAVRGSLAVQAGLLGGAGAYRAVAQTQAPAQARLQAEREKTLGQTPAGQYVQRRRAQLAAEAEGDRSLTNRVARGAGKFVGAAAPAVATGILTGGSLPAIAATTALQSAAQPENAALASAVSVLPLPVGQAFKAGVNAVRRAFGKGAAQIVEAEALPAATAQVRQSIGEVPPVAGETSPTVQRAMQQFEQEIERIKTLPKAQQAAAMEDAVQRIGREASGIRPVSDATRKGYPPQMVMPENPNPIQQPGWTSRGAAEVEAPPPGGRVVTVGDKTYRLTPEQEARWAAEVDEPLAYAKRHRADLAEQQGQQEANKYFKGRAMSVAKTKREIVGALTPKEEAAIAAREATNYKGKPVEVDGQSGVITGMAFGRVKVKLDNGSEITVPPSSITPRGAVMEAGPPQIGTELESPSFGVRAAPEPAYTETVGPSLNEVQGMSMRGPSASAPMDLNAAVADAAESVPRSFAQRAKDEILGTLGAFKSLRSTGDLSYPLRQGALLLLRPLQWRQAGKVWKEMFRAFRTKNFDAIKQAIEAHPLADRMDGAGLYRGMVGGEEAFAQRAGSKVSEIVSKTPGIKHSEQAYTAAADTQRVGAFEQYARLIDKAKLSPEEALKADKAAAQWINIATGRGSLGKRIDRAMEGLNFFFFSPRYIASRLNVLNPAMYIKNASSPGGRVVLRQQMADLAQFASVVGTTLYLAKQAGADVTLNPKSADFGKIKVGSWRWDLGAGLSQVMRLYYRVGEDIARAGRGEKPKFGQSAIDIGETFLSYKLSPPASVFRDFIKQRTVEGKDPTVGHYIENLIVPMQWADFVDAYQKEAWGGVAKTLPGVVGVGVQNYDLGPVDAAIEKSRPVLTELQRLGKTVSELKRRGEGDKKEPDEIFNKRVQQFSQNYTQYGQKLLDSERYKTASDEVKAKALDALNNRAKALTVREFAYPELELNPDTILDSVQSAEERKRERVRQRGF